VEEEVYKIWPVKPLTPGEYAVYQYTEGKGNIQVWDFAWRPAARADALNVETPDARIAEALRGRRTGDEVRLPAAAGEEPCRLVAVAGLDEDVRAWIAGGA